MAGRLRKAMPAAATAAAALLLLLCLVSAPTLAQDLEDPEEPEVAMRSAPVCSVYHPRDCW